LALPSQIIRSFKPKSPELYLKNPSENGGSQTIATEELPLEFTLSHYQAMTGLDAITLQPALSECQQQGLISLESGYCACTDKGWDFLDTVLGKFVA
jgi:oxygen-independent coproporphyrinogen-3 oxidase